MEAGFIPYTKQVLAPGLTNVESSAPWKPNKPGLLVDLLRDWSDSVMNSTEYPAVSYVIFLFIGRKTKIKMG